MDDATTPERDAHIAWLVGALRSMAGPGVVVGARWIRGDDVALLHEVEREAVARSVAKRQREFASGRALLRELIGHDVALPVTARRVPSLPDGVVASLAHDRDVVVAAVSGADGVAALGIDVEPTDVLDPGLALAICRPDEAGIDPHLAFTLKEAAYKAWSNTGGPMLEHHDVRVSLDGDRFSADVVADGTRFDGRFAVVDGRFLALVTVLR